MSEVQGQDQLTGVDTGSVAGNQDGQAQTQAADDTQAGTQTSDQTTTTESRVEEAFARRLSQERERLTENLNNRVRSLFGVSLDELEAQRQGQLQPMNAYPTPTANPVQGYGYNSPQVDVNEQLQNVLYENPAGFVQALAQGVLQQVGQQLAPIQTELNKQRVASRHGDRYKQVEPIVDQILQRRPDLGTSEQGIELAYLTAVGIAADEIISQATSQAVQHANQTTQQMNHGQVMTGEPSGQGGSNASSSPEELLRQSIVNASI